MRTGGSLASRRSFVTGAVLATVAGANTGTSALAAWQDATPGQDMHHIVEAPAWSFALHTIQDPYAGTMQVPAELPAGSRAIAAEIEVSNDADQALNFTPIDVRLRDERGQELRGGAAIGTEPMISPRNLNPGERSRGWVWFIVPEGTSPVEIVYVAPQPQFRLPLG